MVYFLDRFFQVSIFSKVPKKPFFENLIKLFFLIILKMMLFHKKLIKNNLGEVWPNNWFRHFFEANWEKSKKI